MIKNSVFSIIFFLFFPLWEVKPLLAESPQKDFFKKIQLLSNPLTIQTEDLLTDYLFYLETQNLTGSPLNSSPNLFSPTPFFQDFKGGLLKKFAHLAPISPQSKAGEMILNFRELFFLKPFLSQPIPPFRNKRVKNTPSQKDIELKPNNPFLKWKLYQEQATNAFIQKNYPESLRTFQILIGENPGFSQRDSWLSPRTLENGENGEFREIGDTAITAAIRSVAGILVNRVGPQKGEVILNSALSNTDIEVSWLEGGTIDFPIELELGNGTVKNIEYFEINNHQQYLLPKGTRTSKFHLGTRNGFLVLTVIYQSNDPRFALTRIDEVFIFRN